MRLLGLHGIRLVVINTTTDKSVVGTRHVIYLNLGIEQQGCSDGDFLVIAKPLDMANFYH